jgi:hypothetical protein
MLRPCCGGPALLSMFGATGSSVAMFASSHRALFFVISTLMLLVSAVINFRRSGGTVRRSSWPPPARHLSWAQEP